MRVLYYGHEFDCKVLEVLRKRIRVAFETRTGGVQVRDVPADRLRISQIDRTKIIARAETLVGTFRSGAPGLIQGEDWVRLVELLREAGRWPAPIRDITHGSLLRILPYGTEKKVD